MSDWKPAPRNAFKDTPSNTKLGTLVPFKNILRTRFINRNECSYNFGGDEVKKLQTLEK